MADTNGNDDFVNVKVGEVEEKEEVKEEVETSDVLEQILSSPTKKRKLEHFLNELVVEKETKQISDGVSSIQIGEKLTLSEEMNKEKNFVLVFENRTMKPVSFQECDAAFTFVFRFDVKTSFFKWEQYELQDMFELIFENRPTKPKLFTNPIIKSYIFKQDRLSLFKIRTTNRNMFKPIDYTGIMQVEIIFAKH